MKSDVFGATGGQKSKLKVRNFEVEVFLLIEKILRGLKKIFQAQVEKYIFEKRFLIKTEGPN